MNKRPSILQIRLIFNMKVLLVDDNSDLTILLSEFLNEKGLDTEFTNDSMEGLRRIKEEKFDYVVLDNDMPGINGIDIIQTLERENILKNQQIIMLSGASFTSNQIDELLAKEGIKNHLKKPIYIDQIFRAITC